MNITTPQLTQDLTRELEWFTRILNQRINLYFPNGEEVKPEEINSMPAPDLSASASLYAQLIKDFQLGFRERIALALCLTRHLRPRLLDVFFTKNKTFDRPFTEFGGQVPFPRSGFIPTGETLLFILGGSDVTRRLENLPLLEASHPLFYHHVLELKMSKESDTRTNGILQLSPESRSKLLLGKDYEPEFSTQFPAHRIQTERVWSDLVLPAATLRQLQDIFNWIKHENVLLNDWEMKPKIRPGYRSLFYGPPGTGKTMAATLLGQLLGQEVYRVDLSMVVSKYIGETEKNLAAVFNRADHHNWILFFDEADALFGKRTEVKDAHDRYANQEVSYLLQRIEYFKGVIILASNLREHLDDAFTRRFESMIYFPMPSPTERLKLWQQGFSPKAQLAADIRLENIASRYELSGGVIMNVIRHASICALERQGELQHRDLIEGIKRELAKEGRTV